MNGDFDDERQIGSIYVCREDNECTNVNAAPNPNVPPGTLAITGLWASYLLPPSLALEGESQTLRIFGRDAAGNRSEIFTVTYQMDNIPPGLSVTFVAGFVPALGTNLIAEGTVLDGSHVDVNVLVDPPAGVRQRLKAAVVENEWSFTHGWSQSGTYTLWVQAVDQGGNITTTGPFTLLVGEANQVYLPFVFNNAALVPSASLQYLPIVHD